MNDSEIKAEWDASEDLRAEFDDDFDRYRAFAKADAAGLVRVIRDQPGLHRGSENRNAR